MKKENFQKNLTKCKMIDIIIFVVRYGRLAQLVEHSLDVRVVRDSSSLSSTKALTVAVFINFAAVFFSVYIKERTQKDGIAILLHICIKIYQMLNLLNFSIRNKESSKVCKCS